MNESKTKKTRRPPEVVQREKNDKLMKKQGRHRQVFSTCWCAPVEGKTRRVARAKNGTPLGKGGKECADCGSEHIHGKTCNWEGLKARGWTLNGHRPSGEMNWLHPKTSENRVRTKRRRQKKTVEIIGPAGEFLGAISGGKTRRAMKNALRQVPKPKKRDFTERLDSQTQVLWLQTAKARIGGLSNSQIAGVAGLDEKLLDRLVASPAYISFEADFGRVMAQQSGERMEELNRKISLLMDETLETFKWILSLRGTPDGMRKMRDLVAVGKIVAGMAGLDMERKQVDHRHAHLHSFMTPQKAEKLRLALISEKTG